MEIIASILTAVVAIEHCYILWMEMFAWETAGKKTFKSLPKDLFTPTKALAANQGLYNGFLIAGLIWSFLIENHEWSCNIRLFFLGCITVAGIFGGITSGKKIFFLQGIPALITMLFVFLTK